MKRGVEITDAYSEQITSEVFEDRPQLCFVKNHLFRWSFLFVWKYDRIARNPDPGSTSTVEKCGMMIWRSGKVISTLPKTAKY